MDDRRNRSCSFHARPFRAGIATSDPRSPVTMTSIRRGRLGPKMDRWKRARGEAYAAYTLSSELKPSRRRTETPHRSQPR